MATVSSGSALGSSMTAMSKVAEAAPSGIVTVPVVMAAGGPGKTAAGTTLKSVAGVAVVVGATESWTARSPNCSVRVTV